MYSSFEAIKKALQNRETTCSQLVAGYLDRIEKGKHLNAFLEVYAAEALAKAREVDSKLEAGTAGRLAGMVIGLKDVICHEGHGLQAGSKILRGFVSQFSATAVEKLLAEDAIIIGRQNCDEFAMGSSSENSAFGPVRNPVDPTRVPGGSSGGSAVAVAADMCLVSLGSDTGGSVRQPAAFCGVVGVKPTYSRISRHGLIAYASSFDTIGTLSKNIEDAALVLEIIAGPDNFDATVSHEPVPDYTDFLKEAPKRMKIGYLKEAMQSEGVAKDIQANFREVVNWLKTEGHEVEEFEFTYLDYILPTYYILTTAEASTNLSRFDGVRYGYRSPNARDIESLFKHSRSEGFGYEVKRRILLGTFVLSASYYDAYFTKAQKVRRLIQNQTHALLNQFDFLISPTTPTTAFEIGKIGENNILEMYLADLFTVQASVAGIPALSVPTGFGNNGMPIGTQVMGPAFEEGKLLAMGHYLQNRHPLH